MMKEFWLALAILAQVAASDISSALSAGVTVHGGAYTLQSLAAQAPSSPDNSPSVSISLPPNISSDMIQVHYYLTGPFGGYGGYAERRLPSHSYEIKTSVESRPATEIKMVVYAPGCRIQTFDLLITQGSHVKQEFICQPLPRVTLSGQIIPSEMVRNPNTELTVSYMAYWEHEFFGIWDGFVLEFQLATVRPQADGNFQVTLPDFSDDTRGSSSFPQGASLRLMLRDSETLNHISWQLEPEGADLTSEDGHLRIRPFYPSGLKFTDLSKVH